MMYRIGALAVITLSSGFLSNALAMDAALPKIDVTATCRGAGAVAPAVDAKRTIQRCLDSEQASHNLLIKQWPDFPQADRVSCAKAIWTFDPSYTELLSCLEMARDAKKFN
jgi:hypothetical protein